MDKKIIEVLKRIKNDFGESIFENKNKFNSLLSDYVRGKYRGEIDLITKTLTLGLYSEIKATPIEYIKIRSRYLMRLKTEYFWTEEQAIFAIDVWGVVAGVISELGGLPNHSIFCFNIEKEVKTNVEDILIPVEQKDKYGYIDKTGSMVVKPIYNYACNFS